MQLNRELVVCGEEKPDEWTSQAAKIMELSDATVDETACKDQQPKVDTELSTPEFQRQMNSSQQIYYLCLQNGAQRRLDAIKKFDAATTLR